MECSFNTRLPCVISVSCSSQYLCVPGHIYCLPLCPASDVLWGKPEPVVVFGLVFFPPIFASDQIQGDLSTNLHSTVRILDKTNAIINQVFCQSVMWEFSFCYFSNNSRLYFHSENILKLRHSIGHLISLLRLSFPAIQAVLTLYLSIFPLPNPRTLRVCFIRERITTI